MTPNQIADTFESIIHQLLAEFRKQDQAAIDYSLLYNPQKSECWFIVILFEDKHELRTRIKSGVCYSIHSYLQDVIDGVEELKGIERSILFEVGKSPKEHADYDLLFNRLNDKMQAAKSSAGTSVKICNSCGHDFDHHQLMGWPGEDGKMSNHGWIVCPEESCTCFQTWGANYKGTS